MLEGRTSDAERGRRGRTTRASSNTTKPVSRRAAPHDIAPAGASSAGRFERTVKDVLRDIDVQVNGPAPYDPQVQDGRLYRRVLRDGSLGLGESYVDGWWEVREIDALIHRIMSAGLAKQFRERWRLGALAVLSRITNPQSRTRAARNAKSHYERGIDVFRAMLDRRMTYSSGYWRNAGSLDEAQEAHERQRGFS